MVHACRLVYNTPHALLRLWEWQEPHIDNLLRNAHIFSRLVDHRHFPSWEALAGENARLWETHYWRRPMYQPWDTWEAWLAEYRALVVEVGPPAAITGFFTVRRVPWIMLWTVFSIFIN